MGVTSNIVLYSLLGKINCKKFYVSSFGSLRQSVSDLTLLHLFSCVVYVFTLKAACFFDKGVVFSIITSPLASLFDLRVIKSAQRYV